MNACEALQIVKMNLRSGRGRDIATLTRLALQKLRKERKYGTGVVI